MLTVLEGFRNFVEHGVSFLFLPTEFQALSFTSPRVERHRSHLAGVTHTGDGGRIVQPLQQQLQRLKRQNARIRRLTQAFRR
jgi:hypothetical protein